MGNRLYNWFFKVRVPYEWTLRDPKEFAWAPIKWKYVTRFHIIWEWIDDEIVTSIKYYVYDKPGEIYRKFKRAYKRAKYGIDDSMTWDLNYYLAEHIEALLKQYLEQADGTIVINDDYREYINKTIKAFEDYNAHDDKWDEIYSSEIDSNNDVHNELIKKEIKEKNDILRRMRGLFTKNYGKLWW